MWKKGSPDKAMPCPHSHPSHAWVSNKLETKANKNDLDAINAKISKATTQEDLKKATEEIESLALKVAKITENGGSGSTRNTFKKIVE